MRQNAALCGNGLNIARRQIVDCLKLKDFADNNFMRGNNGRKNMDTKKNIEGKTILADKTYRVATRERDIRKFA